MVYYNLIHIHSLLIFKLINNKNQRNNKYPIIKYSIKMRMMTHKYYFQHNYLFENIILYKMLHFDKVINNQQNKYLNICLNIRMK